MYRDHETVHHQTGQENDGAGIPVRVAVRVWLRRGWFATNARCCGHVLQFALFSVFVFFPFCPRALCLVCCVNNFFHWNLF